MSDASDEEKQNFLRETILEKGYDTNSFVQFLIDKKGDDGADVTNWTMKDLKIVVKEFITLNGGTIEEEQPVKQEPKKAAKKISMFDVMGDTKPKPQVQNTQSKPQVQKTQSKPQTQNTQSKPQVQKTQPKPQVQNTQPKPESKPQPAPQKQSMADLFTKTSNTTSNTQKQNNTEQKKTEDEKKNNSNNSSTNKNENTKTNANTNSASSFVVINNTLPSGSDSEYGIISKDTQQCKTIEKTDLSKYEEIKITISNPEKKDNGFFSKAYVTYLISVLPASFKVRRRYSDFAWLRTILQAHFPSNIIPPVPKKSRLGSEKFADSYILKRARGLEKFLNYLTYDPVIKNSQIFYDFLFIGAETDFNSKKKVYEKSKQFTEVKEFRTVDGKANCFISAEKEGYLDNIKDSIYFNTNLLKKLNYSFKQLNDEMNAVINRMEEISQIWDQLYKVSMKYFDNNTTCECNKQMSNLFKTWSKTLKEQNTVINIDIREHFKFIRKNYHSIKELTTSVESYKYNYQKGVKNLISKKDDLFKKADPNKWELDQKEKLDVVNLVSDKKKAVLKMCPKDTQNCINLKELYGFYLNSSINEYERIRKLTGKLDKRAINSSIQKLSDILGQFHKCTGEIICFIDEASQNNSNDNKCQLKRIPYDESLLK